MADAVVKQPLILPLTSLRCLCVYGAILLYAIGGTPTPDSFGYIEIITGALLVIAVGLGGAHRALFKQEGFLWERASQFLLLFGLTVPLVNGLVLGNSLSSILRDVIPFFFFLLPLFLFPLFAGDEKKIRTLTTIVVFGGIIFALRVLWPYIVREGGVNDPFLLANAPTVLFASLLLLGHSFMSLLGDGKPPYALKALVFLLAALVPLSTMALITQRASVGVACMTVAILSGFGFVRKPTRLILPLLLTLIALLAYWPVLSEILDNLMRKTSLVGFNMRWQEALAVFDEVSTTFVSVLIGKGWGASVASPAVGGAVVNFTHSLLTTYWLKTGLIGLVLVLFYLIRLGLMLWPLFLRYPVMALALGGPFLIDVTLYASFKSLDFGLILLLIPLWAGLSHSLHSDGKYSIQE